MNITPLFRFRRRGVVLCLLLILTLLPYVQPSASANGQIEESMQMLPTLGLPPDPSCYGKVSMDNASQVLKVIQRARDSGLLGPAEEVAFNPKAQFYRGLYARNIEYYLDDSIMVILWKEDIEGNSVTFTEVKVADGSQFRRKLGGQVDGRGAVGTADDADGSGLGTCETQKHRTEEGDKHAQLRGGAEKQTLGVGEQRTEVRHGTDAHEDQRGINAGLHTDVEEVKKAAVGHDMPIAVIVGTGSVQKGFPQLRMVQGVVAHADKVAEVGEQTAEGNAAKQQRLELLHDPEVEQNKGNHDHDDVLPTAVCRKECGKTGLQREFLQDTQNIHMGLLMR